jgi:DNA/RNA endonuclease G (NUC1)
MTKEDFIVTALYIWRKVKHVLKATFLSITSPIWVIPFSFYYLFVTEREDADKVWCRHNNYVYPEWHSHPHQRVKEMKRDVRRMERERKKELRIAARQFEKEKIRKELKQKGYDT